MTAGRTPTAAHTTQETTTVRRVAPREATRRLVVFLHGYGASANDLLPVAQALAPSLPDAELVLPDGPIAQGAGRAWWDVTGMTPANRPARLRAAGEALDAWLATELAARGLPHDRVALVGFSQGAALAVWMGTRRRLAGVVSFCGRGADVADETIATPLLLVAGGRDPFIPADEARAAARALAARGAQVTLRWHPLLGHGIDAQGVDEARTFLVARGARSAPSPRGDHVE